MLLSVPQAEGVALHNWILLEPGRHQTGVVRRGGRPVCDPRSHDLGVEEADHLRAEAPLLLDKIFWRRHRRSGAGSRDPGGLLRREPTAILGGVPEAGRGDVAKLLRGVGHILKVWSGVKG